MGVLKLLGNFNQVINRKLAMTGGANMVNCFLFLTCLSFSFACAIARQLYDNAQYVSTHEMIIDVVISGMSGCIFALILSASFKEPLAIIGLSGAGGLFGVESLQALMKSRVSEKIRFKPHHTDMPTKVDVKRTGINNESHAKIHIIDSDKKK